MKISMIVGGPGDLNFARLTKNVDHRFEFEVFEQYRACRAIRFVATGVRGTCTQALNKNASH